MSFSQAVQWVQGRWNALAARERTGISLAGLVLLATVVWQLLMAPALHTLRIADAQARLLDAQLERVQALQTQAKALQSQAPLGFDASVRALKLATEQSLGATGEMAITGDRAMLTLKGVSADNLAQWLAQARLNARALPLEARLTRAATPNGVTWNGVLVLGLPAH